MGAFPKLSVAMDGYSQALQGFNRAHMKRSFMRQTNGSNL